MTLLPGIPRSSRPIGGVASLHGPGLEASAREKLHLFTFGTPMGRKIQIALETLARGYGDKLEYSWERISLPMKIQKSPWYLAYNPDGRIPLLIDRSWPTEGTEHGLVIPESGAILLHLAEHYDPDRLLTFGDPVFRQKMLSAMFFVQSALGPAQAQANHFRMQKSSDAHSTEAVERFVGETHRLYQIVEDAMEGREYWVGPSNGRFSLADIELFGWVHIHDKFKVMSRAEFEESYPNLRDWHGRMWARPEVRAGVEGYDP